MLFDQLIMRTYADFQQKGFSIFVLLHRKTKHENKNAAKIFVNHLYQFHYVWEDAKRKAAPDTL